MTNKKSPKIAPTIKGHSIAGKPYQKAIILYHGFQAEGKGKNDRNTKKRINN